jgi:hypothetical protein
VFRVTASFCPILSDQCPSACIRGFPTGGQPLPGRSATTNWAERLTCHQRTNGSRAEQPVFTTPGERANVALEFAVVSLACRTPGPGKIIAEALSRLHGDAVISTNAQLQYALASAPKRCLRPPTPHTANQHTSRNRFCGSHSMERGSAGLPWLAPRATGMLPSLLRGGLPSHIAPAIFETPPDCGIERGHPAQAKMRIQLHRRSPWAMIPGNGSPLGRRVGGVKSRGFGTLRFAACPCSHQPPLRRRRRRRWSAIASSTRLES